MKRLSLLALTGLLIAGLALPAAMSAAPPSRTALFNDIPVTGTLGNGDPFAGTLDITEITRDGSTLLFDGTLTNTATGAVQQFTDVAATLVQPGATCRILELDLGPIFLDLLGLQVDLSPIHLEINAVPGAGNLLGNLLCAVAGILDGPLGGGLGALLDGLLDAINDLLG
jgi:hypothetical protein